jgi:hypothetical protein
LYVPYVILCGAQKIGRENGWKISEIGVKSVSKSRCVEASGNVPLKRAKDAWEKLYNADDINPSLNPKNLSNVLRDVGVNRAG